jgi:hypothetical protein
MFPHCCVVYFKHLFELSSNIWVPFLLGKNFSVLNLHFIGKLRVSSTITFLGILFYVVCWSIYGLKTIIVVLNQGKGSCQFRGPS